MIPLVDVPFHKPDIEESEVEAVTAVLKKGWLTGGMEVAEFEFEFATKVGAAYAIAVNSATMAALLLFHDLGAQEATVVFPTYTFSGPPMMAHLLGADVVLVDSAIDYNISPIDLGKTLEHLHKWKAKKPIIVVATHFAGHLCDMASLHQVCSQYGAILLEDSAHTSPAQEACTGIGACLYSRAAFFSFYATKTLTTGDGGMICTNDAELYHRLIRLRSNGFSRDVYDRYTNPGRGWEYDVAGPGWKANMTDMAAALGRAQLRRADARLAARQHIALVYDSAIPDIARQSCRTGSRHLYPIQVPSARRDAFISDMLSRGIHCSVHFKPLHMHSYWAEHAKFPALPLAEALFRGEVSLPIFPSMREGQINHVAYNAGEIIRCYRA